MARNLLTKEKDIFKQLAEELPYTEEQIATVWDFLVADIRELIENPEIYAIRLPNQFGVMYEKIGMYKNYIGKNAKSEKPHIVARKIKYTKRIADIEAKCAGRGYQRHLSPSIVYNYGFTRKKSTKELEEHQNATWI